MAPRAVDDRRFHRRRRATRAPKFRVNMRQKIELSCATFGGTVTLCPGVQHTDDDTAREPAASDLACAYIGPWYVHLGVIGILWQ